MPATLTARRSPAFQELSWMAQACRAPKLRSHEEFFESEMVIPTGPFANFRAKISRQPWSRHWLRELNRRRWNHCNMTGCGQGGKSFLGLVEPLAYHLFEMKETVVFGVVDEDMADDKWKRDFLPVIEKTRYKEFLPRRGEGSAGGTLKNMIQFTNGASLKVMTGGGGDNSRAGFTSRVAVITEAEKLAVRGDSSDETSKLQQIMSRVRAFDTDYRIYTESTLTTEQGACWNFHLTGSASRLVKPCPHCGKWVAPDKEDFVGWEGAGDEITAMEQGHFACPECKESISDEQRLAMNHQSVLVHRGQEVTADGQVVGPDPRTLRFSFRFSAFDNQLVSSAGIAKECYDGAQETDQESAQKKLDQYLWARPWKSPLTEEIVLEVRTLLHRQGSGGKGFVPAWCERLTVGVDLRKRQLHYVVMAWKQGFAGQIIDYGILSVRGDSLPVDEAIYEALLELRDLCESGWQIIGKEGEVRIPDAVWFDSHYGWDGCYGFTRDPKTDRSRYRPVEGVGSGDYKKRTKYSRPKAKNAHIRYVGDGYHRELRPASRVIVVEIDVDHWKTKVQQGLAINPAVDGGLPLAGSLVLYETKIHQEHTTLARHLTSERSQTVFEPGVGERKVWVRVGGENHFLDAASYGTCAAYDVGIRPLGLAEAPPEPAPEEPARRLVTPSGMPFFVGER